MGLDMRSLNDDRIPSSRNSGLYIQFTLFENLHKFFSNVRLHSVTGGSSVWGTDVEHHRSPKALRNHGNIHIKTELTEQLALAVVQVMNTCPYDIIHNVECKYNYIILYIILYKINK